MTESEFTQALRDFAAANVNFARTGKTHPEEDKTVLLFDLERRLVEAFARGNNGNAETDIGWAMDRLKAIALTAEDPIDQAHACESIIRSVKVLAGD